ncbi:hypothetical protein PQR72_27670 [Paraburkholderia madseniana]|uniref:hypothetical protein n=1 Tax=Paraburkholderia madseniana TaxID=2599607 RepID=UPI0015C55CAE|nr:hypothetical protein [Paraburkholderia madseniana]NPT68076.1 hypothetical protein [Paraburkholderia madseniana]
MTIEQDFLPFATGGGANVLPQAQYAALGSTSSGYQAGVASSAALNKTWRQSSIIAAMIAQFIVDQSGQPAVDDGTTATLEANLIAAIRSATKTGVILADTGTANAYTAVNVPPLVIGTWVDGVTQQVKIAHANTAASTYAPDGLTAIPIYGLGLQPLQGGELALNGTAVLMRATIAGVNSGNPIAVLMECFGGAQQIAPATQPLHAVQMGQLTGVVGNIQRGKCTVVAGATTATYTADAVIVGTSGGLQYALSNVNLTLNLATTGAGGLDFGSATVNAYVGVYLIYNPTTGTKALYGTLEPGGSALTTLYTGSTGLPSGYTASALVGVLQVSGVVGQFAAQTINNRRTSVRQLLTLQTSTPVGTLTSFNLSGAIPKCATRVGGQTQLVSTATSQIGMSLSMDSVANVGNQNVSGSGGSSYTGDWVTDVATPQTLFYGFTNTAGTPTMNLYVTSFEW